MLWQLAVVRPRMSGIVAYAETLLRGGPDSSAGPPRDPQLADVLGRLGARLSAVEAIATTDQLTGVLNRQTSLMRLAAELQRAARYDGPISAALADIDHFKRVNDTYGHAAGDVVLRHVAQILRSNLRATDTVGRYGGEEFLLVLPEADVDQAVEVAVKLRRLVGRTPVLLPGGEELSVTVSIGVASGRGGGLRLDGITHDADTALYAAKSLGRDQVYLFREVDDERTIHRAAITSAAHDEAVAVGRRAARAAETGSPRPSPARRLCRTALRADRRPCRSPGIGCGPSDGEIRADQDGKPAPRCRQGRDPDEVPVRSRRSGRRPSGEP